MLYTKLRKKQKMERFLYFDKMRFCLTKLTTTNYNGTVRVRGENTNIALIKPFSRNRLLWVFIGATSTHTTPHRPCHAIPLTLFAFHSTQFIECELVLALVLWSHQMLSASIFQAQPAYLVVKLVENRENRNIFWTHILINTRKRAHGVTGWQNETCNRKATIREILRYH